MHVNKVHNKVPKAPTRSASSMASRQPQGTSCMPGLPTGAGPVRCESQPDMHGSDASHALPPAQLLEAAASDSSTAPAHLLLQQAFRKVRAAAAAHQLIGGAVEGHPAVHQGDVQVKHKPQDVLAAGAGAQPQRRAQPGEGGQTQMHMMQEN